MLFAEEIPNTASDVLLLPMIVLFFGAFVYGAGYFKGLQVRSLPRFRWVGLGLIIIAIFLGFLNIWAIYEPQNGTIYRDALVSRKIVYAHYISFALPLLSALAVLALEFLIGKRVANGIDLSLESVERRKTYAVH